MVSRYARISVIIMVMLLLASCGMQKNDSPLGFVAEGGYNVFITIRPAQIWNSDLMQELFDEVSDQTIDRINGDWEDAFGIGIDENTYLFGAIDLPNNIVSGGRVNDAIFIGGGPILDEKIRRVCRNFFRPDDFVERSHNGGTYFVLNPPRDNYTLAYAKTDNAAIVGLEKSVTNSLDVLGGRKKSIVHTTYYSKHSRLIVEDAGITALVWDVDTILEMGTSFLRMQQRNTIPPDTVRAINSLGALGVSVEFKSDLVLTFRGRFEDNAAAEKVRDYIKDVLAGFKEGDGLRDLMILFGRAAEKEEDLLEIIEATEVFTDDSTLIIYQVVPGDSPILYNLRDAFFGAVEAKEEVQKEPTASESENSSTVYELDSNNQVKTVMHLSGLGQAVEMYIMDHPDVGSPKVSNATELGALFDGLNINYQKEWLLDGWANQIIYEAELAGSSKTYRLISYGSDGRPGPQPADPEFITKTEEDIIYSNGRFTQRPRGQTLQQ